MSTHLDFTTLCNGGFGEEIARKQTKKSKGQVDLHLEIDGRTSRLQIHASAQYNDMFKTYTGMTILSAYTRGDPWRSTCALHSPISTPSHSSCTADSSSSSVVRSVRPTLDMLGIGIRIRTAT